MEDLKDKKQATKKPTVKKPFKKKAYKSKKGGKKPSSSETVLAKVRKYISTPKGDWTENDDDVNVSFYKSRVYGESMSFDNKPYSGLNTLATMAGMDEHDVNVGCFASGIQLKKYFDSNKDILPVGNKDFDPEKPFKGLKTIAPIHIWNKTYYENGKMVKDENKIKQYDRMTKQELDQNDVTKFQGLKYLTSVFALEHLQDQLPQSFLDERPAFAKADELKKLRMNPEKENAHFCEIAQRIIDAMGVEVIEKEGSNRAYFNKGKNIIVVPVRERFESDASRLAVVLHELSHSTMIPLDRDFKRGLKTSLGGKETEAEKKAYAKEEVVAELSTAFLTAKLGVKSFTSHAKYIKGYCDQVCANNNDKVLVSLSSQAMKASNYIFEKYEAHTLKLEQDIKLKAEIDPDLKSKSLVLNGNLLLQTIALSKDSKKTFSVAIDLDNPGTIKVKNLKVFKEYQSDKFSETDKKELEKALKEDLRTQLLAKYELQQESLKEAEIERNEAKKNKVSSKVKTKVKARQELKL